MPIHSWFLDNVRLDYRNGHRIWITNNIKITKNISDPAIHIDDILLCYKYYNSGVSSEMREIMLNTPIPAETKIFCYWNHGGRECYEEMQINAATYRDLFADAFAPSQTIKLYNIYPNKLLFERRDGGSKG